MQTCIEKCPFKENGKLSKLFHLVPRGLNLPMGPIRKKTGGQKSRATVPLRQRNQTYGGI
jgi:hypothetical protein